MHVPDELTHLLDLRKIEVDRPKPLRGLGFRTIHDLTARERAKCTIIGGPGEGYFMREN